MDKRKAFTLIELLVVISIIAMLMSILMPSLSKAREQAQRVVCISHLRDLMVGMEVYAAKWEGLYTPCMDGTVMGEGGTPPGGTGAPGSWMANKDYKNIIGYKGAKTKVDFDASESDKAGTVMSPKFSCPTNTFAKRLTKKVLDDNFGTSASYGYNATEWYSYEEEGLPTRHEISRTPVDPPVI